MTVVGTVDIKKQIADYIVVASKTCYRLFTLPVTSKEFLAGNKLFRHCVLKGKENAKLKEFQLDDSSLMYSKLYATTKPNRDRVFYAIPFRSKIVHVLETKRGVSMYVYVKYRYIFFFIRIQKLESFRQSIQVIKSINFF